MIVALMLPSETSVIVGTMLVLVIVMEAATVSAPPFSMLLQTTVTSLDAAGSSEKLMEYCVWVRPDTSRIPLTKMSYPENRLAEIS